MSESEKTPIDGPSSKSDKGKCSLDTTYLRSIEGILRIVTLPIAVLGLVMVFVSLFWRPGGWYIFVGGSYVIYLIIVIVIEMCISEVFIHRLVDGVITLVYAVLWLIAGAASTAVAVIHTSTNLGIAAACAYVVSGLCIVQGCSALWTWRNYEAGKRGSKPILII